MKSPIARLRTPAAVVLMAVLVALPSAAVAALAPAAPGCTPRDRSTSLTSLRLDESRVSAYEALQVFFQGELPDGACAGDTVRISIPSLMRLHAGTYPVSDQANAELGRLVVDPKTYTATVRFTKQVETGTGPFRFLGRIHTSLSPVATPGRKYELAWGVGKRKITTPLQAADCDRCDRPRTGGHAWSTLEGDTIYFALESAPARTAGDEIGFTAHVAPGQAVRCQTLKASTARVGEWGQLVWDATVPLRAITCGADRARFNKGGAYISAKARSNRAGQYLVLSANSAVSDKTLARYNVFGQISQTGYRGNVVASAARFDSGGSGLVPAPAPAAPSTGTPTPSTSPSAEPDDEATTSAGAVSSRTEEPGPDRGPILIAGLVTFIAGAIIVSLGLRRRS